MPLFDPNNLEHTSCIHGSCGSPAGNTQIIYFSEDPPTKQFKPNKKVITSDLKRSDFVEPDQ
jgi:hypothetical protein